MRTTTHLWLAVGVSWVLGLILIFVMLAAAVQVIEIAECQKWADEPSIAQWQQQQCAHHNLPLNGTVRPETIR